MTFYDADLTNLAKKNQKSAIKKAANITGFAFFMMTSVMIFWSVPVTVVIELVAKRPNEVLKYLNDPTIVQVIQICVSSIAFIFPFIIYSKMMGKRLSDIASFNKPKEKGLMFPLVLLGLGVCGFSNAVVSGAGAILQQFGFNYNVVSTENPTNIFGIILSFVATAVTPALVEEFAMRGVLLGVLRKYGDGFSIIVSSLVFGLMHGTPISIIYATSLGILMGWLYAKFNSIVPSLLFHFTFNFSSVILATFEIDPLILGLIALLCSVLFALCVVYIAICGKSTVINGEQKDTEKPNNDGFDNNGSNGDGSGSGSGDGFSVE